MDEVQNYLDYLERERRWEELSSKRVKLIVLLRFCGKSARYLGYFIFALGVPCSVYLFVERGFRSAFLMFLACIFIGVASIELSSYLLQMVKNLVPKNWRARGAN